MSTGWLRKAGEWVLTILGVIVFWVVMEWLDGHEVRLDRHYHARVALEEEVRVLRHLVRQQDKQIDCYYETVAPQANFYQRRKAESACLELAND